jgi:hypothetical protein
MHTLIVLAIGFLLLGATLVVARLFGGLGNGPLAVAALWFLPLWLIGAGINLWIGVAGAGYSVKEELPIFLLVFAVPAGAALLLWWRYRLAA